MQENRYVRIENSRLNVDRDCGFFKTALLFVLTCIACNQCKSGVELNRANELRKQQLEVAKKQYQLDSLRYYAPIKQR